MSATGDRVEPANKRDDVRYAPIAPNLQRKPRWLFSATGIAFERVRSKKKEGPSLSSAAAVQRWRPQVGGNFP